ncbi:hypothetical protein ACJX0J_032757, partial [Zea mays]
MFAVAQDFVLIIMFAWWFGQIYIDIAIHIHGFFTMQKNCINKKNTRSVFLFIAFYKI